VKGNDLLAKNKVMYTCGKCPTYNNCTKGNMETLFCSVGKISCTLTKNLYLSDLSGYPDNGTESRILLYEWFGK
jgi:hypothetical protein